MANKVYPAESVDAIFKAAADMCSGLIEVVEEQNAELATMERDLAIAKAAAAGKVELEKVASSGTSEEWANKLAQTLAAYDMIPAGDVEKYANYCMKDPDAAAKFAVKALQVSELPEQQGAGVKSAADSKRTARDEENEYWATYCRSYQ